MTLKDPADDPGSWRVDEGLKGKSLYTEPYIFVMIPAKIPAKKKIELELEDLGSKNNWWGTISWGGINND